MQVYLPDDLRALATAEQGVLVRAI